MRNGSGSGDVVNESSRGAATTFRNKLEAPRHCPAGVLHSFASEGEVAAVNAEVCRGREDEMRLHDHGNVCGGVWRNVEVCGGVWVCVSVCGGVWRSAEVR